MIIEKTDIEGALIIKPRVFEDSRGYFFESFHQQLLQEAGLNEHFVQDNQSLSQAGVLRGLHFQAPPHAQGKLVRVITGAVLDVAVDIRKKSPTYGKHLAVELSEENKTMFYLPAGFAHGFLTLRNNTVFQYKCTNYYHKAAEGCLLWNDLDLNINWGVKTPVLSDKDKEGTMFKLFISPF
ncbi:MAG: dTDP-4-dehydrorhamnose 3,5-epimerase [Bacteroidetes bacterium]|nr:dTDP-4-dehydrorhamnose 3,5-epimerase [Bacteroidota bacterium]